MRNKQEELYNLLSHVFLPRKVETCNINIPPTELLQLFIDTLGSTLASEFPQSYSLLTGSVPIYNCFEKNSLSKAFQKNTSFIVFLEKQNSLFTAKPKGVDYQIELYPSPNATEEHVFNNVKYQLPQASYILERSKISESFVDQIISLCHFTFPDALPQVKKKKSKN